MLPNSSSSQRSHGTVCTRSKSHFLVRIRPRQSRPLTRVRARDPLPPRYSGTFWICTSASRHVDNWGHPIRAGVGVLRRAASLSNQRNRPLVALYLKQLARAALSGTTFAFTARLAVLDISA